MLGAALFWCAALVRWVRLARAWWTVAGPGRLAVVGPDPLDVGLWMLVTAAITTPLGLLAGSATTAVAERLSASR